MEKKISMINSFAETFEPLMKSKGFNRKGKYFHRIVNDQIVQTMSYYSSIASTKFTIDFTILPLCSGFEFISPEGGERMVTSFRGKDVSWDYQRAGAYVEYMPMALKAVEELLIPRFDMLVDYKSYRENKDFSRIKFSDLYYKLALVFGDYAEAQASRESYIKDWHEANRYNQGIFGDKFYISPQQQEHFDRMCKEYEQMKKAMDTNDRKAIEEYIASQEQKTLDSYVKTYSTPKKYEKYLATRELPFEVVRI